jgi:hypothetical protein
MTDERELHFHVGRVNQQATPMMPQQNQMMRTGIHPNAVSAPGPSCTLGIPFAARSTRIMVEADTENQNTNPTEVLRKQPATTRNAVARRSKITIRE